LRLFWESLFRSTRASGLTLQPAADFHMLSSAHWWQASERGLNPPSRLKKAVVGRRDQRSASRKVFDRTSFRNPCRSRESRPCRRFRAFFIGPKGPRRSIDWVGRARLLISAYQNRFSAGGLSGSFASDLRFWLTHVLKKFQVRDRCCKADDRSSYDLRSTPLRNTSATGFPWNSFHRKTHCGSSRRTSGDVIYMTNCQKGRSVGLNLLRMCKGYHRIDEGNKNGGEAVTFRGGPVFPMVRGIRGANRTFSWGALG